MVDVNTSDMVSWQRSVSSYLNTFSEFVNSFDVDTMDAGALRQAFKAFQRMAVPSAPLDDGGVGSAIASLSNEVARMNKISLLGGRVINNAMGIGLIIDPDESEVGGGGGGDSYKIDPEEHDHTTPQLAHAEHTHYLSGGHRHSVVICQTTYYTSYESAGDITSAVVDAHGAANTGETHLDVVPV